MQFNPTARPRPRGCADCRYCNFMLNFQHGGSLFRNVCCAFVFILEKTALTTIPKIASEVAATFALLRAHQGVFDVLGAPARGTLSGDAAIVALRKADVGALRTEETGRDDLVLGAGCADVYVLQKTTCALDRIGDGRFSRRAPVQKAHCQKAALRLRFGAQDVGDGVTCKGS